MNSFKEVFDSELYKRVLDYRECRRQLTVLSNSTWVLPFLDASAKIPSGILTLNLHEYGDYFECLGIDHRLNDVHLQGKYCIINVPMTQRELMPTLPSKPVFSKFPTSGTKVVNNLVLQLSNIAEDARRSSNINSITTYPSARLNLGVCIPRPCTVQQVYSFINNKLPFPSLSFKEGYCRLPNDKPYATADYIAAGVFATLFLITLLSTCYDLFQVFVRKRTKSNRLLTSFSIYSNTKSLLTFRSDKTTLECVDGIRGLSMLWVILGHTYIIGFFPAIHNGLDTIKWSTQRSSIWIHTAPMVVDTYFVLAGIFCIYGKPVKYSATRFIKTLHKFYIYRYLRLLPLLAVTVLLQASVLNWISDGPNWVGMAHATQQCRKKWWTTLLNIQNHYRFTEICVFQSWYVAVDVQLYFISPIILVFLFGSTTLAWIVMVTALLGSIISSVVYSYVYKFPSALINVWYTQNYQDYFQKFYAHTPVRAAPFVIGIMIGQVLRLNTGKRIRIRKMHVIILWIMSLAVMTFCSISIFNTVQPSYYEFTYFDTTLNAFMRPLWGAAIGWLVLACVHGYGGPVNWFLSLSMWKFPSRVSYAVYLVHLEIMILKVTSAQKVRYFTNLDTIYRCASDIFLSVIIAFILCVLVDAPVNRLMRIVFAPEKNPEESSDDSTLEVSNDRKTKL